MSDDSTPFRQRKKTTRARRLRVPLDDVPRERASDPGPEAAFPLEVEPEVAVSVLLTSPVASAPGPPESGSAAADAYATHPSPAPPRPLTEPPRPPSQPPPPPVTPPRSNPPQPFMPAVVYGRSVIVGSTSPSPSPPGVRAGEAPAPAPAAAQVSLASSSPAGAWSALDADTTTPQGIPAFLSDPDGAAAVLAGPSSSVLVRAAAAPSAAPVGSPPETLLPPVETAAASSTAADTVVGPEPEEEFQPEISIEEATGEDDDLEAWAGYAPSVGGSLDDGRAPAPSETPRDPRMGSAEDAATTPGTVSAADGAREASTDPSAFDERPSAEAHLAAESVPTPREAPAEPGSQAPETAGDRGQPEESAAVVSADLLAAEDDAEPLHEPEVLEADVTEAGPERRQGPATPPASPEAGSAASAVPTPLPTPASPAPMPPPPPPTTGPAPSPPATAARIAPPPPPPAPPVTTPRGAVAPPPAPAPARPAASPHPAPSAEEEPTRPKKKRGKAWYEEFFDDAYLRTVRPPRPEQVSRQCDFIEYALQLPKGSTILDVGCGLGLQAIELASRGYLVVGLDLSLPMLARAADEAQDRGVKLNFLHGDMRDMQFDGQFDAVLCLGTTFGYFDDETNKQVLERMRRALKPQGLLLLDSVNRDYVIAGQPNLVWFEGDGCICMEETHFNYITSRLHVKRTVIYDDGRQRDNDYSIRLYALNEIGQLLHHMGFRVAEVSGMEATPGVYFGAHSPRLILLAERRPDAPRLDPPRPEPPRPDAPRPETGKVAAGVPHDGDPPSTA